MQVGLGQLSLGTRETHEIETGDLYRARYRNPASWVRRWCGVEVSKFVFPFVWECGVGGWLGGSVLGLGGCVRGNWYWCVLVVVEREVGSMVCTARQRWSAVPETCWMSDNSPVG